MTNYKRKRTSIKHSVTIGGVKSSVSLEATVLDALKEIATEREMDVTSLINEIDAARDGANLSSAIRVYVLTFFRGKRNNSAG